MRAAKRKAAPPDAVALLRLVRTEGVGPVTFRRLLERYGSAAAALDALPGLTKTPLPETATADTPRITDWFVTDTGVNPQIAHGFATSNAKMRLLSAAYNLPPLSDNALALIPASRAENDDWPMTARAAWPV